MNNPPNNDYFELGTKYPTAYGKIYFECGPGWRHILDRLGEALEPHGVVVGQVKEKFGGLRVYIDSYPEDSDACADVVAAVRASVELAATTCEECGKPGTLQRDDGWWRTRCVVCR